MILSFKTKAKDGLLFLAHGKESFLSIEMKGGYVVYQVMKLCLMSNQMKRLYEVLNGKYTIWKNVWATLSNVSTKDETLCKV